MTIDQELLQQVLQALLAIAVLVVVPALRAWLRERAQEARASGHRAIVEVLERLAEQAVDATEEWARREVAGLAPHSRGEKKRTHAVQLLQERAARVGAPIGTRDAEALVEGALARRRAQEAGR